MHRLLELWSFYGGNVSEPVYKITMSTHLTTGKINIGQIQELSRNKLLSLLEKCDGSKVS